MASSNGKTLAPNSPFRLDNVDQAFAAYCALPHLRRKDRKKPTKTEFKKMYAAKRIELNGDAVAAAKGDAPADLMQQFAEFLFAQGIDLPGIEATKPTADTRKPKATAPKDAARNGVLWRLNVEGLLTEALEASEGEYITQAAGQATLTNTFGPLS